MSDKENTDAALRSALQDGYHRIRGYVRRGLPDSAHARDVMNAFCERANGRAATVAEGAAVKSWLSRVLASTIADHYRAMQRRARRESELDLADEIESIGIDPSLLKLFVVAWVA